MSTPTTTRTEHDLLGDKDVPADAYWGVHTLRARENFPITGMPISAYPHLVDGARGGEGGRRRAANAELGLLPPPMPTRSTRPARRSAPGALHDQFVVDVIQGGAGTSTNMNANEVIANRALELLGHAKGDYAHLHPNEHVNLEPVHQRRLPDRRQHRDDHRRARTRRGDDRAAAGLRRQGRRVLAT